jgi:uncharacterized membrane protein YdjX (TVP38/TMEM64 family)
MNRVKSFFKPTLFFAFFSLLITLLYTTGCFEYFKWSVWKDIHGDIKEFVSLHLWISVFFAALSYVVVILTFLPGLLLLDLLIGYMFPQTLGVLIIGTSAVVGAMVIVSACRFGFKNFFLKNDNKLLKKIQKGFSENETMYLLFLRFVPFFPFALVSAGLSTLPVSYKKIAITTFIGMMPLAFVLTSVGRSFGELMKLEAMPKFTEIVSEEIMIAFFVLSMISVLHVLIKRFVKS